MTVYDISHLEKTALAMTKKNWSDHASQDFDDAFRPSVAFQLVRDLQAARRNERHNGEAWGKAEARLANASRSAEIRLAHLSRLHSWFLKSAPEHYAGCGLYTDVKRILADAAVSESPVGSDSTVCPQILSSDAQSVRPDGGEG